MVPLLPPLGDPNHKELISFIEINKTGDSGYSRHYDGAKSRAGAQPLGHIFMQMQRLFRAPQDLHFMLPLSTRPTQGGSIAVALRTLASG
ncbi:hypothetical protein PC1_2425 [Pectobacterium carotovorum subsp. carotovorum PC1]|uniref:Uncharacterized protein n=1 Tax=Pectobacterium carotovorum subsp. carotovorum (strain PC1) TaxID=561230 RepID=C6DK73_PECCP|nr:hypothetical protein PC1_2425 [Pectobacterium carotovorum subsp. carotovorum PC1]